MSSGCFVFTPKPLTLDVIIQDSKAENGKPFRYPDEEIDWLHYRPTLSEMYEGMFDPIKDALPKYSCEFWSDRFGYPSNASYDPEWTEMWNEASIRALTRLAAFIRKCVEEMGEFWYTKQWIEKVPQSPEKMAIVEMNVDDLKFKGEGIDHFSFYKGVFYKFMDI